MKGNVNNAALEAVTIDVCCGGHTAYMADMSICLKCGEQFCRKHDCSCPVQQGQLRGPLSCFVL
jgi:hypothetical protein